MKIYETKVHGCLAIDVKLYEDVRGTFVEAWNEETFSDLGLPLIWPQDNLSISRQGVLRGMHIQRRNPQGKLVRCVSGTIFDVCLDLRKGSPTFLMWHGEVLSNGRAMYCPPGTAHGFLALEPRSVVYYKCTTLYDKDSDGGVNPFDLEADIKWPFQTGHIVSDKDRGLPSARKWIAQGGTWTHSNQNSSLSV